MVRWRDGAEQLGSEGRLIGFTDKKQMSIKKREHTWAHTRTRSLPADYFRLKFTLQEVAQSLLEVGGRRCSGGSTGVEPAVS